MDKEIQEIQHDMFLEVFPTKEEHKIIRKLLIKQVNINTRVRVVCSCGQYNHIDEYSYYDCGVHYEAYQGKVRFYDCMAKVPEKCRNEGYIENFGTIEIIMMNNDIILERYYNPVDTIKRYDEIKNQLCERIK
jgi:hypothetical protein